MNHKNVWFFGEIFNNQKLSILIINVFLCILISVHAWEVNNDLADHFMSKALQAISYPQDRNSTWLPDIELPLLGSYRLVLESGRLTGLKQAKRIGNGIIHRPEKSNIITVHTVLGIPQLQFSYSAGSRIMMLFGTHWPLTGTIDLLVLDVAFDVIANGSRKGQVENIIKADHRYLINLHINGFERSLYRFFVTEEVIKQKIKDVLNLKLNELSQSIQSMSLMDAI